MNKKTIITILLAIVAMAGQAQTPKDSCSIPKDSLCQERSIPIAVGTGTWGIAAVIPKYLSLRLPKRIPPNTIPPATASMTSVPILA